MNLTKEIQMTEKQELNIWLKQGSIFEMTFANPENRNPVDCVVLAGAGELTYSMNGSTILNQALSLEPGASFYVRLNWPPELQEWTIHLEGTGKGKPIKVDLSDERIKEWLGLQDHQELERLQELIKQNEAQPPNSYKVFLYDKTPVNQFRFWVVEESG
jgi:hypothetical protein